MNSFLLGPVTGTRKELDQCDFFSALLFLNPMAICKYLLLNRLCLQLSHLPDEDCHCIFLLDRHILKIFIKKKNTKKSLCYYSSPLKVSRKEKRFRKKWKKEALFRNTPLKLHWTLELKQISLLLWEPLLTECC